MIEKVIFSVKQIGQKILQLYLKEYSIQRKKDNSFVTEADLLSNQMLQQSLAEFGWPILSEESKDDLRRLNQSKVWIIDPLDGTYDFLKKTGDFAIMVALVEKSQPVLGVVYQPAKAKLYFAQKGQGAFLQINQQSPQKISVSTKSKKAGIKMLTSRNNLNEAINQVAQKMNIKEIERVGSNGVKMCLLAEGYADIFFNPTTKLGQWDVCAPEIILEEAGGRVTDILGQKIIYNQKELNLTKGVAASNKILHDQLINYTKSSIN